MDYVTLSTTSRFLPLTDITDNYKNQEYAIYFQLCRNYHLTVDQFIYLVLYLFLQDHSIIFSSTLIGKNILI